VDADLTAAQHAGLVAALHQQWRVAAQAVMFLLSAGGHVRRRDRR
jgi:hypothetical protein